MLMDKQAVNIVVQGFGITLQARAVVHCVALGKQWQMKVNWNAQTVLWESSWARKVQPNATSVERACMLLYKPCRRVRAASSADISLVMAPPRVVTACQVFLLQSHIIRTVVCVWLACGTTSWREATAPTALLVCTRRRRDNATAPSAALGCMVLQWAVLCVFAFRVTWVVFKI